MLLLADNRVMQSTISSDLLTNLEMLLLHYNNNHSSQMSNIKFVVIAASCLVAASLVTSFIGIFAR